MLAGAVGCGFGFLSASKIGWAAVAAAFSLVFLALAGLQVSEALRKWRQRMDHGEPPLAFDQEGMWITSNRLVRRPPRRRVLWSEVDSFNVPGCAGAPLVW